MAARDTRTKSKCGGRVPISYCTYQPRERYLESRYLEGGPASAISTVLAGTPAAAYRRKCYSI
jgi:hypothetical protein